MTIKIDKKITKYRVDKPEAKPEPGKGEERRAEVAELRKDGGKVIWMHEKLERPEVLIGSTYKIKTPVSDHAMYVTINDIVLNEGTDHEHRRPFEVFINSKTLDHCQWIVALIIAELGYVIEKHLQTIGLMARPELDPHRKKMIDEKREEFEARKQQTDAFARTDYPEGAQLCLKCSTAAVVMMDGCMTCLNCGDSKCG